MWVKHEKRKRVSDETAQTIPESKAESYQNPDNTNDA
jgi:hypothetical protein